MRYWTSYITVNVTLFLEIICTVMYKLSRKMSVWESSRSSFNVCHGLIHYLFIKYNILVTCRRYTTWKAVTWLHPRTWDLKEKKSKETTISDSCCILNPLVKVRHTAAVQTLDMRFYM